LCSNFHLHTRHLSYSVSAAEPAGLTGISA
jgi:hypothetical protein